MADSSDENAHSDFDSVPPTLRQFKVVQTQDRVSYYISNAGVPMDTQNYAFASVRRLTIYFVGADALQKITGQGFGQDWAAWTHWWKTKNPSARLAIDSSWADWPMPNGPADVVAGAPNPDSYTDNRDGTVTDNVTGLMWQQTVPSIHDFPFGCPWADAVAYCQTLTLASYSDWRLPSRIELVSLVDEERYDARTIGRLSIDPTYFPNTPGTHYFWSSSPKAGRGSPHAWAVHFLSPDTVSPDITETNAVRCVRSASPAASAPAERYVMASGTVYDTRTKLTWQQTVPSETHTWADAKTHCAGVGASLGGTGWRLPTIKELQTIVDDSRTNPSIDPTAFPSTPATYFWSSTPRASSEALIVSFDFGYTSHHDVSKTNQVRCVR
jgi:hypothetical protein